MGNGVSLLLFLYFSFRFSSCFLLFGITAPTVLLYNASSLLWKLTRFSVVARGISDFCCSMQDLLVAACGIQFPDQGLNPSPSALGAWSLGHWNTREAAVQFLSFYARHTSDVRIMCEDVEDEPELCSLTDLGSSHLISLNLNFLPLTKEIKHMALHGRCDTKVNFEVTLKMSI